VEKRHHDAKRVLTLILSPLVLLTMWFLVIRTLSTFCPVWKDGRGGDEVDEVMISMREWTKRERRRVVGLKAWKGGSKGKESRRATHLDGSDGDTVTTLAMVSSEEDLTKRRKE
jgi:hypothetical protein